MGKENIEQHSRGYALLKSVAGAWHNNVFYRKIIVLGREHINPANHLIFAPNHQNALMDALAVLFTHKGQPVFLARADIFRRKALASFLYFLKILPVYRIRDGFSSLKGNDEIFDKTVDVLRNRNGLVILPEGTHEGVRRLRQLKKGICRIAFQADEASGFSMKIKIIPVGLDFSNYQRYRQVLTVVYGRPIEVSEFHELYRKSPEKALNELRDKLSYEMKSIMVHIDSEEDYEAIDELRSIINGRYSDDIRLPKLFRDRMLIEKLNRLKRVNQELYKDVCSLGLMIKQKARELGLSYRVLSMKKHHPWLIVTGLLALVLTFPLFLFGNIFNLTFLEIPNLHSRKIRDIQFHSSIKYGLSLALALIFLPLYFFLSILIFSPWWLGILIYVTLPLTGLFAWFYYLEFQIIFGGIRKSRYQWSKNPEYTLLKANYDRLHKIVSAL
jgi:1-acyl-sn-glycerol-3-phosphate acyltransferase